MKTLRKSRCPGCGLRLPTGSAPAYEGYYNASPECWGVYTEVLGAEFGSAVLYGQVHQLTADAYAVQHAGGRHPDRSVGIHLCGLHLVLVRGHPPPYVPPFLQRLAARVPAWPRFHPPPDTGPTTVLDVARAGSVEEHVERVRSWAGTVWSAWSDYHAEVAALIDRYLPSLRPPRTEPGAPR